MQAIFEQITADIVAAIEAGADTYEMPWHRVGDGLPANALTGTPYRGTNVLALWAARASRSFLTNRWATYRQWDHLGGQVRNGSRGTTIVFWKVTDTADLADRDGNAPGFRRFIAKAARVFNADQVDNAPVDSVSEPLDPSARIASAQTFFDQIPATISYGGNQAFYDATVDTITLPKFAEFKSASAFYSVLAHELTHWTGPKHRLDRDLSGRFGSSAYAVEELVAELGASFLCAHLGVGTEPRRDHAPYLSSWLTAMRADARALVSAANQAQAAVDFLIEQSSTDGADSRAIAAEAA